MNSAAKQRDRKIARGLWVLALSALLLVLPASHLWASSGEGEPSVTVKMVGRLGHPIVRAVSISPNGRWVVIATAEPGDAPVYMLDADRQAVQKVTLRGVDNYDIRSIAIDNSGTVVAALRKGGLVTLRGGAIARSHPQVQDALVATSAAGTFAVAGTTSEGHVLLVGTAQELSKAPPIAVKSGLGQLKSVAISPSGKVIALLDSAGKLSVWRNGAATELWALPKHSYVRVVVTENTAVAWTTEGDAYAVRFEAGPRGPLCRPIIPATVDLVSAAWDDPDWLYVVGPEGAYSAKSTEWLRGDKESMEKLADDLGSYFPLAVGGSRRDVRLVLLDPGTGSVRVQHLHREAAWDTGVKVSVFPIVDVALSPDLRHLAFLKRHTLYVAKVGDAGPLRRYSDWPGGTIPVRLTYTSNDVIAVGTIEGHVVLVDTTEQAKPRLLEFPTAKFDDTEDLSPFDEASMAVATLPGGRLVNAQHGGWLVVWNLQSGTMECMWLGGAGGFDTLRPGVAHTPVPCVVTCSLDLGVPAGYAMYVWSRMGRLLWKWKLLDAVLAYGCDREGGTVAVAYVRPEFPVYVYSLTGKPLAQLRGHPDSPVAIHFLDGSGLVAVGGTFGWLWVWDWRTAQPVLRRWPHGAPIIAISGRTKLFAVGSRDGTVTLWTASVKN